jgi:GNAT superfamily N-acetyltransferase
VTVVRSAGVEDAGSIGEVHVRSWQGAYRGLIPQEYLDGLDPQQSARTWVRIIGSLERPRAGVLIAEDAGEVLGFASFGPTRDEGEDPLRTGEVTAIYLDPAAWSAGSGRALMSGALERLASAGYQQATLWVLDTNARARRFYQAAGFEPDGAEKQDDRGSFVLRELRYRRPLG